MNKYDDKPACDVGGQTMRAIEDFERYPIISEKETTDSAGNGAIMRLAPIIIANTFPKKKYPSLKDGYEKGGLAIGPEDDKSEYIELKDIEPTINMAVLSCRETHNSIAAEATTALFATTLYCALHSLPKNHIATYCSRWIMDEDYDACYGQLAGAYYGYEAIPEEWRKDVYHADELVEIADDLLKMPECPVIRTRFEDNKYFKEPK